MSKVWGGLALAAGVAFAVFIFEDGAEGRRIDKQGVEATVEPISQYREVRRRGEGIRYSVDLKFKTDKGAPVTVKRMVSHNIIEQSRSGQPVRVRYIPGEVSALKVLGNEEPWLTKLLMWGVTAFFILFGIAAFWRSGNNDKK